MSGEETCEVFSDFAIRLEVGLARARGPRYRATLELGPNHRTFELQRGLNADVLRNIIVPWLRTNRRHLDYIKRGRIRVVESEAAA